jgi:HK97 gp10 family phage protein
MPTAPDPIKVEGFNETRKALSAIDKGSAKAIKRATRPAAEIVVREAIRNAPVWPGEPRTPWRITDSIRVSATQTGAAVRFGGPKAPHTFVHEFGGTIRRRGGEGGSARTRRRRGVGDAGRTVIEAQPFLYPAIEAKRGEVLEVFTSEFDKLLREFPQL